MSTLYLVPTPLGDPDDITLRALRILREVRAIVDFSVSDRLTFLDHYGINDQSKISADDAFEALELGDVAMIVPRMPGIREWAHEIVVEAIARGIRVEPLPGGSAEITALVLSGLPTEAFVYVDDLPDDLSRYAHEHETMVFMIFNPTEALRRLIAALGDRRICIATHLTRPDEIIYRGTIKAALTDFPKLWAGEVFLVVEGAPPEIAEVWDEARVRIVLREHLRQGKPLKEAAKEIARMAGWDRRAVYALGVDEKQNPP